jgi:hypothetical protein
MPRCCEETKFQFNNASTTTIAYSDAMRDMYGTQPRVFVWYYDPVTGEFYLSTFFTVIKFNGSNINIDHGGPSTGIVVVT